MIIGKSITALGGGGLKPEIRVTAKAGALLNLYYKDSSIILQSYQLGADETMHTFVVNVSETAYVVEDATNSASVEVLVDAVARYNVEIPYTLYLYKDGEEFTDITGGWTARYETSGVGTFTKYSTYMYAKSNGTSYGSIGGSTVNKIKVDPYKQLNVVLSTYYDSYGQYAFGIGLSNGYNPAGNGKSAFIQSTSGGISSPCTCTLDISECVGEFNVGWFVPWRNQYGTVTKIWLD